jgi:hypothetical protein
VLLDVWVVGGVPVHIEKIQYLLFGQYFALLVENFKVVRFQFIIKFFKLYKKLRELDSCGVTSLVRRTRCGLTIATV